MYKLMNIPYGSRLYGTWDENSDHDWKIIYLPGLEDMLVGAHIRNKFYSSADSRAKNTSDDTDTELIAIQTFARDVLDGQTYALEVAFGCLQASNIPGAVIHDDRFPGFVRSLLDRFLTSNINAMVGYAYHQSQLYSAKGGRLDKLGQFLNFLIGKQAHLNAVHPNTDHKLGVTFGMTDANDAHLFDKLVYVTTTPNPDGSEQRCYSVLEKLYPEGITIDEAISRVKKTISKYGARAKQAMINEGKDWKAISHAVRITHEALDVLNKQYIQLPFDRQLVEQLIAIKYGRIEWSIVQQHLESNIDRIKECQLSSPLQSKDPELLAEFELFLKQQMMNFYSGQLP